MTDTGAEALMHAIVKRACVDYKKAARRLRESRYDKKASHMKRECERFFHSQYCYNLTGITGEDFLTRLRRQLKNERAAS